MSRLHYLNYTNSLIKNKERFELSHLNRSKMTKFKAYDLKGNLTNEFDK
jgi:hypothetical protein